MDPYKAEFSLVQVAAVQFTRQEVEALQRALRHYTGPFGDTLSAVVGSIQRHVRLGVAAKPEVTLHEADVLHRCLCDADEHLSRHRMTDNDIGSLKAQMGGLLEQFDKRARVLTGIRVK